MPTLSADGGPGLLRPLAGGSPRLVSGVVDGTGDWGGAVSGLTVPPTAAWTCPEPWT
jgi:hypothetical protein